MHTSWKVTAAAAGLLITGTALGTLAVHAQSAPPKPDPSKSSYISVNEEDFATVMARMSAAKASIMKRQMDLLGARYDLGDRPAAGVTMSRGKPVQDGVRVRLPAGTTWDALAKMTPDEIRDKGLYPAGFMPLPHENHPEGGMVFPLFQITEIKKQTGRDLTRFDLDFDIPDRFLPEFPAPIYLTTRPDLGDVSQGKLVTTDNYYRLFNGLLNPKQLEGLRLLLTPFPQQQFNATADRRSEHASLGVACFDCHQNGHTNGADHLVGDIRPQEFRHRIETTSLRGVNIQRLFGSQRALKTVEDFTEFEQRAAYFDGDPVIATQEGRQRPRARQPGSLHGRVPGDPRLSTGAEARRLRQARPQEGDAGRAARASRLLRQGHLRDLPCAPVLHRQPDAQPPGRAVLQAGDDQRHDGDRRRRRSRPSRCGASRILRPTCTTAGS